MPPPLSDGQVSYSQNKDDDPSNDVPETVDQYAKDVAAFLMWAAEPHLVERKAMGMTVMIFLVIFACLVYYTKKKVWTAFRTGLTASLRSRRAPVTAPLPGSRLQRWLASLLLSLGGAEWKRCSALSAGRDSTTCRVSNTPSGSGSIGPWGEPSDDILFAELGGLKLRFLPRHGRGHRLSPTHINYRANIDAMKRAGVTDIVSVSAVGSLRGGFCSGPVRHRRPVHRPHLRARKSFFGEGVTAHVSMAQPVSPLLASASRLRPKRRRSPSTAAASIL